MKESVRSSDLLEIIYIDICGHFPIATMTGLRYYISNALNVFKIYKSKVEHQLEETIKIVRSDRGGEYHGKFGDANQFLGPSANFLQEIA